MSTNSVYSKPILKISQVDTDVDEVPMVVLHGKTGGRRRG